MATDNGSNMVKSFRSSFQVDAFHGTAQNDELTEYFKVPKLIETAYPLVFWMDQREKYPTLSKLVLEILVIPATSAPIERVFAQASIEASGKRNRLSGDQLERSHD
jgi:hAT family C-terminal dimerisation region